MTSIVEKLARGLAVLGGVVLTVIVLLICVSIIGRSLDGFAASDWLEQAAPGFAIWLDRTGVGPVQGDFEIVETGIAFVIFCFLPICQFLSGHATVDIFTSKLPRIFQRLLMTLWEIALSAVILLITVQLFHGMMDKFGTGQTTFQLQYPVWIGYAASFAVAVLASGVAVFCAGARVLELISGRPILPGAEGGSH